MGIGCCCIGTVNNRNTFANAFFKESLNEEKDGRNNALIQLFSNETNA